MAGPAQRRPQYHPGPPSANHADSQSGWAGFVHMVSVEAGDRPAPIAPGRSDRHLTATNLKSRGYPAFLATGLGAHSCRSQ